MTGTSRGGHAADAAHTADDDGGGQAHEHDAGDAGSDGKAVVEGVSHGIDCTMLPMPKVAMAAKKAKSVASHFQPSPREM